MTKSFVATRVLQLVGEGRLRLDDNLERWLPGLVPGGKRITVRQLLNHTSGLSNYTDDLPEPPRRFRPRELVAIATGHRLADQLQQRILQPLGLDDRAADHPAGTCWPTCPRLCAPNADRQLVMATNLNPEPEPGAATAAVENILRREVSC